MAFGNGLEQHKTEHSRAMRLAALIGVGALGVLLLLTRHSSASGGVSSAQEQQDIANALQQQQATNQNAALGTPSTFADNGAQAAGLADAVTQGLGGVQDALTNFTAAQQAGSTPVTAAPPDAAGVAAVGALGAALTTVLANNGQKTSGGSAPSASPNGRPSVGSPAGTHGAVVAPYGGRPPDKPGFRTVGTGRGGWIYVPNQRQQVANHGGGQKQAGGQKKNAHTRK